jgi:hypothetical protein
MWDQYFKKHFDKSGIGLHDPRLGTWWKKTAHQSHHAEYNRSWKEFFENFRRLNDRDPELKDVLEKAESLSGKWGFDWSFVN